LLYERPAFPPLQRTLHIHSFRAPPSGGKIPENPHCSFSVEDSVARPLSFRPVRGAPSSSALICLHSRHIVAVIVSPRSKPASSARLRSCSISRLRAAGSLKVIASLSCFHLRTPIAFLLHRLDCRLTSRTGRGIRGPGLPTRQTVVALPDFDRGRSVHSLANHLLAQRTGMPAPSRSIRAPSYTSLRPIARTCSAASAHWVERAAEKWASRVQSA
jgi:hypothetical protein